MAVENVESMEKRGARGLGWNPSSDPTPCSTRSPRLTVEELCAKVRQVAFDLHVYLGNGLLEKVYENGLKHRLEKAGFEVEAQKPLKVFDEDGYEIGDYFADLVVDGRLIVELKATKAIAAEHLAQTMNYLKITGYPLAIIINFGSYQFETRKVVPPKKRELAVENVESMENLAGLGSMPSSSPLSPCSTRSPRLTVEELCAKVRHIQEGLTL